MAQNVMERVAANNTEYKIAVFKQKQTLPYEAKVVHTEIRAREFYEQLNGQCFVSVGGLDSITLLLFLRSIGIDVPGVSVSSLEDKSIQAIHMQLDIHSNCNRTIGIHDSRLKTILFCIASALKVCGSSSTKSAGIVIITSSNPLSTLKSDSEETASLSDVLEAATEETGADEAVA